MKKNPNKLIPLFLSSFTDYKSNLKARLKADSLVVNLEENANKLFTQFVDLSSERYKAAKSGWSIYKILNTQTPQYSKIHSKIRNDVLFNSTCLSNIKKKLSKTVNRTKNKEINNLRSQISESMKFKKIKIKKNISNISKDGNAIENNKTENNEKHNTIEDVNSGNSKINYISNEIFLNDNKKFNKDLEDYYNLLDKMRTMSDKCPDKIKRKKLFKETKNKIGEMKTKLNTDNMEILNYTGTIIKNNHLSSKKDNDFFVYMNYLSRLKYLHNKGENKTVASFPSVFYNSSNNFKRKEDNFKDTINLVKKESDDSSQIKNKFIKNRRNFSKLLNKMKITDNFGDLNEIEKNIKLKFRNKIKKNSINIEKKEDIKESKSVNQKNNYSYSGMIPNYLDKYETKMQRRQKINEQFKEIYEDKINEWSLQTKNKGSKKE